MPRRITPAHAGKRGLEISDFLGEKDHPRTRGEKAPPVASVPGEQGSPPHTRGKGIAGTDSAAEKRITPAHAGKSIVERETFGMYEDHPRTRGEKPKVT